MSYQSGCHGRVVLGTLPEAVQRELEKLPGEWLEFDPETGAIVISHVQPSTGPILPTVTVELVRLLSEVPYELHGTIAGGDLFVHTEATGQLVRLRVEPGGSLGIQWAHPEYAGATKRPYAGGREIAVPPWEQRLNGALSFESEDPTAAAGALQALADTFEGLYPEGHFHAAAEEDTPRVTVEMRDVNLDGQLLVERLQRLALPRTLEGRFELGSFAEFVPEHLIRFVFEKGEIWVQHPLLWS